MLRSKNRSPEVGSHFVASLFHRFNNIDYKRRSRESGNPGLLGCWIPAFAGMTVI